MERNRRPEGDFLKAEAAVIATTALLAFMLIRFFI
jgi:hypothetical protein